MRADEARLRQASGETIADEMERSADFAGADDDDRFGFGRDVADDARDAGLQDAGLLRGDRGDRRDRGERRDRDDRSDRGERRSSSEASGDAVAVSFEDEFDAELRSDFGDLGPGRQARRDR